MTVRDIQHHLASTLSVELSVGTISRITDAVADAVLEWQRRPLEEFYPVVYHGRDSGQGPRRSPGRLPLGSHRGRGGHGRYQARPGYLGPGRGGSLLEGRLVCAELANRGVKDVLIVEGAPPARERSARGNVTGSPAFPKRSRRPGPQATVPTCAGTTRFRAPGCGSSPYGDRRKVAAALKADLHRPAPGGRLAGSDRLLRVRHGGQAPFRR